MIALEHDNKEIYELLLSLDNIDYNTSSILGFFINEIQKIIL